MSNSRLPNVASAMTRASTPEEAKALYKRFARLLHPNKQVESKRNQASRDFVELGRLYEAQLARFSVRPQQPRKPAGPVVRPRPGQYSNVRRSNRTRQWQEWQRRRKLEFARLLAQAQARSSRRSQRTRLRSRMPGMRLIEKGTGLTGRVATYPRALVAYPRALAAYSRLLASAIRQRMLRATR